MRRLKTALKWIGIVAGSLASVALLVSAVRSWRAGACVAERLSAVRQEGSPLRLADLTREPISPERNAATFLRRAEKSLDAASKEFSPLSMNADDYYEHSRPNEHGRLNQRGVDLVERVLSAYPDVLPLLQQADSAADYVPGHDYTLSTEEFLEKYLPSTSQHRQVARFLQYRGDLLLVRGNRDESLAGGLMLLRLDRHFEREPMIVGYLVSLAIRSMAVGQIARALQDGSVSAELHQELDTELTRELDSQAFLWAISSERAFGIESFRNLRTMNGWVGELLAWQFKQDECDYLKRMADEIKLGTTPQYQAKLELNRMQAESTDARTLTSLIIPPLQGAREAAQRSRARLQCLAVLNALSQSPSKADGQPRLGELHLGAKIKIDPYNGQPLRIKRIKGGWVVYSVGGNLIDDGGKIEESEDVGVGPGG